MSFLCSTMIPTYKRPGLVLKAIQSFRDTALNPDCHEVVVRLSEKDPLAKQQRDLILAAHGNCKVFIGKHMDGYFNLGDYYTEMLPHCSGEWLNIWDDDMTIEGFHWDERLKEAPKRSMVVCSRYQLGPSLYDYGSCDGSGTGWFVHRATWEAAGETQIGFPPDSYMVLIMRRNGWAVHQLGGITLNHQWQRPMDGNR